MDSIGSDFDLDFLKKVNVLYVEDEDDVREALSRFLGRRCGSLSSARNGLEGLEMFRQGHHDVVVTDVRMPVMDGLEMIRQIKAISDDVPVIVVTAFNEVDYFMRAIEVGVDSYVKKPIDSSELLKTIHKNALASFRQKESERRQRTAFDTVQKALIALSTAINVHIAGIDGHETKVADLSEAIAAQMGLPPDRIEGIRLGAIIHDIGNLYVSGELLRSDKKLTREEMQSVAQHPSAGFNIVKDISCQWPIQQIILQHHERLDGSGYPSGLKGDQIALEARIVAVADVVEAMISQRPYHPALGLEEAMREIAENSGKLYDTQVVEACLAVLRKSYG